MKTLKLLFIFALVMVVFPSNIFAHGDCLTGKEFAAYRKANKKLIVVDVRSPRDYAKRHVMKAVNIFHKDLYKDPSIKGMLKSPADLAAIFGKKGITTDSKVVIYDDGSSKYSTRVYWILKYLGAKDVKILHKDMTQWKMARIPLTASATPVKKATFTPAVNNAIFANTDQVKTAQKNANALILDVRPANEFAGNTEKSKGHIPGSINIPYKEVLRANGSFKSKADLEALAAKYKLSPDKEIILYCVTSVRASVVYFALKNIFSFFGQ